MGLLSSISSGMSRTPLYKVATLVRRSSGSKGGLISGTANLSARIRATYNSRVGQRIDLRA